MKYIALIISLSTSIICIDSKLSIATQEVSKSIESTLAQARKKNIFSESPNFDLWLMRTMQVVETYVKNFGHGDRDLKKIFGLCSDTASLLQKIFIQIHASDKPLSVSYRDITDNLAQINTLLETVTFTFYKEDKKQVAKILSEVSTALTIIKEKIKETQNVFNILGLVPRATAYEILGVKKGIEQKQLESVYTEIMKNLESKSKFGNVAYKDAQDIVTQAYNTIKKEKGFK